MTRRSARSSRTTSAMAQPPARQKVFVAIPCMDWLCLSLHRTLMDIQTANAMAESRFRFTFEYSNGTSPVETARNELAEKFMATDAEILLFMDTDIMPHNKILRILWSHADIAAAIAPVRHFDNHYWNVYRRADNKFVPDFARAGGQHEHEGVGFGAVAIKRHVFEKVGAPYFRVRRDARGMTVVGEDLDFCERARAAGCTIVADHELRCGHIHESNLADVLPWEVRAAETATASGTAGQLRLVGAESR